LRPYSAYLYDEALRWEGRKAVDLMAEPPQFADPAPSHPANAASGEAERAREAAPWSSPGHAEVAVEVSLLIEPWGLERTGDPTLSVLEDGRGQEAAATLNSLGQLRTVQRRYLEAAKQHRLALVAALRAGGAESPEAEAAYRGLGHVQAQLHRAGHTQEAAELRADAEAVADEAGVPVESPGRRAGERRLWAAEQGAA